MRPVITVNSVLRLRWTGDEPLQIWAGQYYGTVAAWAAASPGQSEIVLPVSDDLDTVLVGMNATAGRPTIGRTLRFELELLSP